MGEVIKDRTKCITQHKNVDRKADNAKNYKGTSQYKHESRTTKEVTNDGNAKHIQSERRTTQRQSETKTDSVNEHRSDRADDIMTERRTDRTHYTKNEGER